MKNGILIILMAIGLLSCNSKPSNQTSAPDITLKSNTLFVYQPIDLDTLRHNQNSFIGNDDSFIDIKTYSLNDSSIVFTEGFKKEFFHNYETKITIGSAGRIIQKATFSRDDFRDSLQEPFKNKSVLKSVTYDFIRSNCHYFDFVLETPNNNTTLNGEFMLFYRTKKKGLFYYGLKQNNAPAE